MTAALPALMGYLHRSLPAELPPARLTTLLYLADWRAALRLGRQLSALRWRFDHFGPAAADLDLEPARAPLGEEERRILDHVVHIADEQPWEELERLVYSTYPAVASDRYTELDLVVLAKEYRQELAVVQSRGGADRQAGRTGE